MLKLVFTDIVGTSYDTQSIESNPSLYSDDSHRTVGDTAVDAVDIRSSVADTSHQSGPSCLTAEEIIKHAAETAVLKRLSGSLLLSSSAVACTEMPCRDEQIDGAEDSRDPSCERTEQAVHSSDTVDSRQLKPTDRSAAAESADNVSTSTSQKTVSVAALKSGVYITKPTPSSTSSQKVEDNDAAMLHLGRRRIQFQKQFPILHDLSQRPQQL